MNDYLAKRDARWMGAIYEFLGMRTGVVVPGMTPRDKRDAYAADVIYATNNELGFDYLRDNMAFSNADKMQRELAFAIVDEVDSILIDEARTPLIISGPTDESSELYVRVNRLIPRLERQHEEDGPGDYSVDEKAKQVHLTEDGHEKVESGSRGGRHPPRRPEPLRSDQHRPGAPPQRRAARACAVPAKRRVHLCATGRS